MILPLKRHGLDIFTLHNAFITKTTLKGKGNFMQLSQRLAYATLTDTIYRTRGLSFRHPASTSVAKYPQPIPSKIQYETFIVTPNPTNRENTQHILNAQRLRTLSFSQAFGVSFSGFHPSSELPLDCDSFDDYCTHVLVYASAERDSFGQPLLVATTRLLDKQGAVNAGHFYSENEFKLNELLAEYPYNVLEMGRTCIHPQYRDVATIHQLWSAIGKVAKTLDANAFMGCASIPLEANMMQAEDIQHWLDNQKNEIKLPIKTTQKLPISTGYNTTKTHANTLPALLKMYLRMGCSIGNEACYDAAFECADIFIWLPFEQIKPRYQHYIA